MRPGGANRRESDDKSAALRQIRRCLECLFFHPRRVAGQTEAHFSPIMFTRRSLPAPILFSFPLHAAATDQAWQQVAHADAGTTGMDPHLMKGEDYRNPLRAPP